MKRGILLGGAVAMALGAVALAVAAGRKSHNERTPVASFDLKRYMGSWYEIARFEMRFERGLDHVQAHYELGPDNRVTVVNSGVDIRTGKRREARGKAYATSVPGWLRVSFFWFFYSDYIVLELGEGYEWALVGGGSSKYLWILSRTPSLPARTLDRIIGLAKKRGYPVGKLQFVNQK